MKRRQAKSSRPSRKNLTKGSGPGQRNMLPGPGRQNRLLQRRRRTWLFSRKRKTSTCRQRPGCATPCRRSSPSTGGSGSPWRRPLTRCGLWNKPVLRGRRIFDNTRIFLKIIQELFYNNIFITIQEPFLINARALSRERLLSFFLLIILLLFISIYCSYLFILISVQYVYI